MSLQSLTGNFLITDEQIADFRRDGFVRLPNAMPASLLNELGLALDRIMLHAVSNDQMLVMHEVDGNTYVTSTDALLRFPEPVFAQLLGSPFLLTIAEKICGPDFFPVQEFTVVKYRHDDQEVKWHQDVKNEIPGRTCMIGFYLDGSDEANGALRVVKGSQLSQKHICELIKEESMCVSMQAGDVLVHDLRLAHSSGTVQEQERRRVVYYEFMSGRQVIEEGIYPAAFVQSRTSLIPAAMKIFEKSFPTEKSFEWKHPEKENYQSDLEPEALIMKICDVPVKSKAAEYCFEGII